MCELKKNSIFIEKGKIVPNWIAKITKGNKKQKIGVTSNGFYVYRVNGSIICFPKNDGEYCIKIDGVKNISLTINPYGINGGHFTSCHTDALKVSMVGVKNFGNIAKFCTGNSK